MTTCQCRLQPVPWRLSLEAETLAPSPVRRPPCCLQPRPAAASEPRQSQWDAGFCCPPRGWGFQVWDQGGSLWSGGCGPGRPAAGSCSGPGRPRSSLGPRKASQTAEDQTPDPSQWRHWRPLQRGRRLTQCLDVTTSGDSRTRGVSAPCSVSVCWQTWPRPRDQWGSPDTCAPRSTGLCPPPPAQCTAAQSPASRRGPAAAWCRCCPLRGPGPRPRWSWGQTEARWAGEREERARRQARPRGQPGRDSPPWRSRSPPARGCPQCRGPRWGRPWLSASDPWRCGTSGGWTPGPCRCLPCPRSPRPSCPGGPGPWAGPGRGARGTRWAWPGCSRCRPRWPGCSSSPRRRSADSSPGWGWPGCDHHYQMSAHMSPGPRTGGGRPRVPSTPADIQQWRVSRVCRWTPPSPPGWRSCCSDAPQSPGPRGLHWTLVCWACWSSVSWSWRPRPRASWCDDPRCGGSRRGSSPQQAGRHGTGQPCARGSPGSGWRRWRWPSPPWSRSPRPPWPPCSQSAPDTRTRLSGGRRDQLSHWPSLQTGASRWCCCDPPCPPWCCRHSWSGPGSWDHRRMFFVPRPKRKTDWRSVGLWSPPFCFSPRHFLVFLWHHLQTSRNYPRHSLQSGSLAVTRLYQRHLQSTNLAVECHGNCISACSHHSVLDPGLRLSPNVCSNLFLTWN